MLKCLEFYGNVVESKVSCFIKRSTEARGNRISTLKALQIACRLAWVVSLVQDEAGEIAASTND